MRMTIIRDDGVVGVDGLFRPVDLSTLPREIRAVQWNGASGHVEYTDSAKAENTPLETITDFQPFIDRWIAAAPQPPARPRAAELKAAALGRINEAYGAAVAALTEDYPQDEVKSWPRQEMEARAWLADAGAATPWIDQAAAGRGIAKAELVGRIMAKAALFAPLHGELTGKRQRLRDRIAALGESPSQEELDAIRW
ncbi:hypothetical protein SAMN05216420_10421 [Nitrosospira sp. Nl5]|uniref:hypothetical protein n=1 Tax=Nitrosospira sp. Nl5 TaxID=200120 RepID=UPI00088E22A2|nr:hypothetical protein [Nitrosospira sp. Nl5]SCY25916.1 hypothetical protein SAMN05216420_10421 [Nitrosospira sp. Nl5]